MHGLAWWNKWLVVGLCFFVNRDIWLLDVYRWRLTTTVKQITLVRDADATTT